MLSPLLAGERFLELADLPKAKADWKAAATAPAEGQADKK